MKPKHTTFKTFNVESAELMQTYYKKLTYVQIDSNSNLDKPDNQVLSAAIIG